MKYTINLQPLAWVCALCTMSVSTWAQSPPDRDRAVLTNAPAVSLLPDRVPVVGALSAHPLLGDAVAAVQAVQSHNAELAFERARLEQSRSSLGVAYSEWWPQLLLTSLQGRKDVQTDSLSVDRKNYDYSYRDNGLEMRWNLFSGGATLHRTQKAQLQFRADELRLAQKLQQTAYEAVASYLEVQRARENYQNLLNSRQSIAALLAKVRSRGTAGLVAPVEVIRIESRYLAIENQLHDQYRAVVSAENAFTEVTRHRLGSDLLPVGFYPGMDLAQVQNLSVAQFLEAARLHPMRLQAELMAQMRESDRGEARSAFMPQLDLTVRKSHSNNTNGYYDVRGSRQNDTAAYLNLRWTLFDGFGNVGRYEAVGFAIKAAGHAVEDVASRVDQRVGDAWAQLSMASSRLDSARQGQTSAQTTAAQYEELVLSGRRSLVEGVNVLEELMRANMELTNQRVYAVAASYRLAYEAGLMDVQAMTPALVAGAHRK
jgi:outer membrane protein TolC